MNQNNFNIIYFTLDNKCLFKNKITPLNEINDDFILIIIDKKNKEGKTERRELEVDFVCNEGYRRWYIQSAWRMDDEDKRTQETESLRRIDDSFRKIIIVGDRQPRYQDENGILYLSLFDFLLDENSLDE